MKRRRLAQQSFAGLQEEWYPKCQPMHQELQPDLESIHSECQGGNVLQESQLVKLEWMKKENLE